jgi:hypothetical protein
VIRRLQLLPAEGRSSGGRLATISGRIRDDLLRDNKVVPAVFGLLALLLFAWLVAGALMEGPDEEEASNQSSLAQGQDSESGSQEAPAPGAENRDTDSYSAFESKDPFRSLVSKAGESKAGDSKGGDSIAGEPKGGERKAGVSKGVDSPPGGRPSAIPPNDSRPSGAPRGDQGGGGPVDQPSPGDPGGEGAGQEGAPRQGSNDPLFNSGGDLPVP